MCDARLCFGLSWPRNLSAKSRMAAVNSFDDGSALLAARRSAETTLRPPIGSRLPRVVDRSGPLFLHTHCSQVFNGLLVDAARHNL